jgi:hypothetical protein
MKLFTDLQRRQIARALECHKYEFTDDARILLPAHKLAMGGVFTCDVNGGDATVSPNMVVNEGLVDLLKVYFQGSAQQTGFYLAPFSGNVAPVATLTAAAFTATQTELTAYSQSARVPWVKPGAAITTPSIDNTASPGAFSINADAQTVWGFGMLTAQAKSATTGVLVAAAQFTTSKSVNNGDSLNVSYTFSASST